MKGLKWLHPGIKVKRWVALSVFGIIMTSVGFVLVVSETDPSSQQGASIVTLIGVTIIIVAGRKIFNSIVSVFLPQREDEFFDRLYSKRVLEKGPKIVVIGGGTGLSAFLHGIKEYTSNIAAIVTVADDGGSSGRLRQEFGVLPPGDIRNCIVALADSETLMSRLFQFRFKKGSGLEGHSFGNLFITAMAEVVGGDFEKAVKESSKVLAIRGNVIPATLQKVRLVAEYTDGSKEIGESKIPEKHLPIKRVYLDRSCAPTEEAIVAIRKADVIVLGPGSLYTSILPNLLVDTIADEIYASSAVKIYACNVMTQHGETDGYKASDHLKALVNHTGKMLVKYCIVNSTVIPNDMLVKYRSEQSDPVQVDETVIESMGAYVRKADLVNIRDYVRHDSHKLARAVMDIVAEDENVYA